MSPNVKVSPDEYLEIAAGTRASPEGVLEVGESLNLVTHPLKSTIRVLPPAIINGDLFVDGTCAVERIECAARRYMSLKGAVVREVAPSFGDGRPTLKLLAMDCPSLKAVSGHYKEALLFNSGVEALTGDFICSEHLDITGCDKLATLNCQAGRISARGSGVSSLGPDFKVSELLMDGCRNLKTIGRIEGLKFAVFCGSGIEAVDPSFLCSGETSFENCPRLKRLSGTFGKITVSLASLESLKSMGAREAHFIGCRLPPRADNTNIGSLKLESCDLEELPSGILGAGQLDILRCEHFCRLPQKWRGNIRLAELPRMTQTPEGFAGGGLEIKDCDSMKLVRGYFEGDLTVSGSKLLECLGQDILVKGDLFVRNGSFVKNLNCRVLGSVNANRSEIRSTGDDFFCYLDATFVHCGKLASLRGFVGGNVNLTSSGVTSLGADFECGGHLIARHTRSLDILNCTVGGSADLDKSSIMRTGPAFTCGKNLSLILGAHDRMETLQGIVGGDIFISAKTKTRLMKSGKFNARERALSKEDSGKVSGEPPLSDKMRSLTQGLFGRGAQGWRGQDRQTEGI